VNALRTGDIDFVESIPFDLVAILAAKKDLTVETLDRLGFQIVGRMNFLYPPFDNVRVRRAALMAMNQRDMLDALVGSSEYYQVCGAVFGCDTPLATDVGSESLVNGNGMPEAKKLLAESGYDGTPIVIMAPGDVLMFKAQPIVAAQLLRRAGFNVDLQATDWQTVVSRRASQKPPSEGGWNLFFTNFIIADVVDPAVNILVNGRGKSGGWFGWPESAELEALKDQFVRASSHAEQKKIAAEIQTVVYDQVIYLPLGQWRGVGAWRKALSGVLDGPATPIFWNIEKLE
jgi:peptide/nickel transport system substrate-binding protein